MPKRPRTHQLETESKNKFKSLIPSTWVVRDIDEDYGIDQEVEIFDDSEKATQYKFYVQLKSTDETNPKKYVKEQFKVDTLDYLVKQQYPVLLLKYVKIEDKCFYKWVFGKHKVPKKNGAKTYTVYFPTENIFDENSVHKIAEDVKKYLDFKNKRVSFPLNLSLEIANSFVSKPDLIFQCEKISKEGYRYIHFSDDGGIGRILIEKDSCLVDLGAESSTFGFYLSEKDSVETIFNKIVLGTGILLSFNRFTQLSAEMISFGYTEKSFFKDSEFVIPILRTLYDANKFEDLKKVYAWMLRETSYPDEVKMFVFQLYKNYRRTLEVEEKLTESLFLENLQCSYEKKDGLVGTSYYNLGNFYGSIGRDYLSVKFLNKARKYDLLYAERAYYWRELGVTLFNNGKLLFAKHCYSKAISLGDDKDAQAKFADCLAYEGRYKKALEAFGKYFDQVAEKQKEESVFPEPIFLIKSNSIEFLTSVFNINDRPRASEDSNKLAYLSNPPSESELIEAIKLDLLNTGALFNLGVTCAGKQDFDTAMHAFSLSASFNQSDTICWREAFLCSMKSSTMEQGAIIFAAAFRSCSDEFINCLFEYANSNMSAEEASGFKQYMLEMRKVCIPTDGEFEFRLIGPDRELKSLKF